MLIPCRKIDITVGEALNRYFQCATIQLDFQLPQRFNLTYMTANPAGAAQGQDGEAAPAPAPASVPATVPEGDKDDKKQPESKDPPPGYARPVMIHRAIIGSFERMLGILTEHFAGKWPFWLSPRQILIVPVLKQENDYAEEVQQIFRSRGFHADVDISGKTMK